MYNQLFVEQLNEAITYFPEVFPIEKEMKLSRSGVSRMVMLDRYSLKDMSLKTLKEGDLVLLTAVEHPEFPTRALGYIQTLSKESQEATILLEEEYRSHAPATNGIVVRSLEKIEKPLELFYEQIAKRNARGLAAPEKEEVRAEREKSFEKLLVNELLIPAGRVLYGAGSNSDVTYFNCYVMPYIRDSREGISKHREETMEIMSRGGGVGTNGSTLRPRNTLARGVNGKSSGSVSWLDDLAALTKLVSQGGSRRGAQMILMADYHPDIVEFVISKMQNPDILRHIIQTIKDPHIIEMAKAKLNFIPLSDMEKSIMEIALSALTDKEILAKEEVKVQKHIKKTLENGGTYSVKNPEFLSGANISVALTHEFMKAGENDEMYELRFPDVETYTKKEMKVYNKEWHKIGDVREWEKLGRRVKTYRTMAAKDLWKLINICATYSAEPGVFFIDNANDMTNASAYGQKVVATNPCGEQPLAPYSVCNLAAINLAIMSDFKTRTLNEPLLKESVRESVRIQDNVIDATPYFLDNNKTQALGERRIGLGVMGLADLLIKMGIPYGSEEGIEVVDRVFEIIAVTAYKTSIELSVEKGEFPFLIGKNTEETQEKRHAFINSGFMKKMPTSIRLDILENGIRNSHLLTVAPTGSTGTMMGVSTGLEPYYAFSYYRSGRLGADIEVHAKIVEDYYEAFPEEVDNPLPDYFVSAMELPPEAHVNTQCAIQRWIDSSLSKTVNAPKGYTVEQVQKVYESLHEGGAKGGTVYVDGSRNAQVLSLLADGQDSVQDDLSETLTNTLEVPVEQQFGTNIGDTCPICKEGQVIDSGGCSTCSSCGAQLKCGL